MTSREMIFYFGGGGAAFILFISICYWSINFLMKQIAERTYQEFREHLAKEAQLAIQLFREGLCEQIVHQENKSDCLAKLYASLIDLMRIGKGLLASLADRDLPQAEKRLRTLRDTCSTFSEMYQKQSLHYSDEFCATLEGFIGQQKAIMHLIESRWNVTQKDAPETNGSLAEVKRSWLEFEDRITALMDTLRNEFRKRQPSPGNIMLKWLNEVPPPKKIASPTSKD